MYYFSIFFKKFNKPCVNFLRVWTKIANCWESLKIFDLNSIEKLHFYFIFKFIFRKFVTKNRAFGNNTIFLQQFFWFRAFPPPLATPLVCRQAVCGLHAFLSFQRTRVKLSRLSDKWLIGTTIRAASA